MAEKIINIMNHYGLNKQEFAARTGVSQSVLSHISSGRNKPGLELVVSILKEFKDINPDWLLLDNHSMFRPEEGLRNKEEIMKLLEEILLLNQMNNNNIIDRLGILKSKIK